MNTHDEHIVQELWKKHKNGTLQKDPQLVPLMRSMMAMLPKGQLSGMLQIMSVSHEPTKISNYVLNGIESMSLYKDKTKNLILFGLTNDNSTVYPFLSEYLRGQAKVHVDIFVNYPYSKSDKALSLIQGSYRAGKVFSLNHLPTGYYQNVRFHACDLRAQWMATVVNGEKRYESEGNVVKRVRLLGAYANFLKNHNRNEFLEAMAANPIDYDTMVGLDDDLIQLEGKIMKSFSKAQDQNLANRMIQYYRTLIKPCRLELAVLKKNWENDARSVVPTEEYIEFLKHLNHLYQYINILYTMLRMYRNFTNVPGLHSDAPDHCIVLLPYPMVNIIESFLEKQLVWSEKKHTAHSDNMMSQQRVEEWLHEWQN